jgi:hypothetical protein
MFDIIIMTVSRPGGYIDQTLASLSPDRPVTLVVGSPSTDYLDWYRDNLNFKIVAPGHDEFAFLEGATVGRRAAWNYWRCLGAGANDLRRLIFEDDVIFAAGWEPRTARTIEAIEKDHRDYVISLYYPYPLEESREGFIEYPCSKFYGTQGVLFGGRSSREFREYLYERGVKRWTLPYDLLLQHFTAEAGVPLFATVPSLVQHIGVVSTGQSDHFHTTTCFVEDVSRLDHDKPERSFPTLRR